MTDQGSNHAWPTGNLTASARLQSLRDLLTSERHNGIDQQRALEVLEHEVYERSETGRPHYLDRRRRRDFDTHVQDHGPSDIQNSTRPVPTTAALLRARRRAFRPTQRLLRHRETQTDTPRIEQSASLTTTRGPTPPFGYTENFTGQYLHDRPGEQDRCRVKRRKLDDGTFDDENKTVRYGDKGRVTPGPLKMEIVSCDGGEYDEPAKGMAQHVLKDDKSVYSTKSNRCNMLLKHSGGAPFSLTKIVFRAPRYGYDAPVQEGMIFIAMDEESILEKAAQPDLRHSAKNLSWHIREHRRPPVPRAPLPSNRSPLRSIDRSRSPGPAFSHPPWLHYGENLSELETDLVSGFDVSFTDPSDSEEPPLSSPPSPYRWRDDDNTRSGRLFAHTDRYRSMYNDDLSYVELSATSDDSDDEDSPFRPALPPALGDHPSDRSSQQRRPVTRMRIGSEGPEMHAPSIGQMTRRTFDEWQDLHHLISTRRPTSLNTNARNHDQSTHTGLSSWGQLSDTAKQLLDDSSSPKASRGPSDNIAPHARFFIHRHKSSIAVNFDPPVSGRYMLIKLWAACPNANIDIQSIIAHGYGGPRFFPAQDFR